MSLDTNRRSLIKAAALTVPALALGSGMTTASASAATTTPATTTPAMVVVTNIKADTRNDGGTGGAVSTPISNKTPTFFSDGGTVFYADGVNISVDLLVVKIVLATKNATFDYAYGTSSSSWSLPDGNSGKVKMSDGTTGYIYEFVYEGPKLAGTTMVSSPEHSFQVVSGGGALLGTAFSAQIEAIVNGKRQNRSADVATIVRNGYSANLVVGDGGVL